MGSEGVRLVLTTYQESESETLKMPKELLTIEMERDSLQQKWGFTVQGGLDLSLTAKIASVKRFSPADRAGLEKMDYVFTVNGKEVFNMTQPQITAEIVQSPLKMVLQVERGTFIVPSFDEIWPQAGKESSKDARRKRMGMEVNQYNNPIECYADETIDDMGEEKVIVDHPEMAEKIPKGNTQKHEKVQMNPIAAQKLKSANFDPKRSAVMMAINAQ